MHVDYLADHVEQVLVVAEWPMHDTEALSAAKRAEILTTRLNRRRLPLTLVALSGSAPIGVVSLIPDPDGSTAEGAPWLTDLYVPEELRRQGIGSALVRRAVEEAWEQGHDRLLARPGEYEHFARGLGWEVASGRAGSGGTRVMEIRPTHQRPE